MPSAALHFLLAERRSRQHSALYHATPLHYLPSILWIGALIAAAFGKAMGIQPRQTAKRRDRMLQLDAYIHFALDFLTPLLLDKLHRGLPHVVLVFDREAVLREEKCGLIPFNTKAWKSKACFTPIEDRYEIEEFLWRREQFHPVSSAELLVRERLSLHHCRRIVAFDPSHADYAARLLKIFAPDLQIDIVRQGGLHYRAGHDSPRLREYLERCIADKLVYPSPNLRFD